MTVDTRSVSIKGRDIDVIAVTETQFMLMGREGSRLQRLMRKETIGKDDMPMVLGSMANVLDMLENRVVKEDDRDYLIELMKAGDLELSDLLPIVNAFTDDEEAPKPVVRRGRTKRS